MPYGDNGSTFGGNPLGCAVAMTAIETLESEKLVENSKNTGKYLKDKFNELKDKI